MPLTGKFSCPIGTVVNSEEEGEKFRIEYWELEEAKLDECELSGWRFHVGHGLLDFAREAVETEAISQRVLIDLLRARLDGLLPEPLSRVLEREKRQRRQIAAALAPKRRRRLR